MVPLLIGELCLHTDSVQVFDLVSSSNFASYCFIIIILLQKVLYLGNELGVVTVGDDNNVLLWKVSC